MNGQITVSTTRDNRGLLTAMSNNRQDIGSTTLSQYTMGFALNLTIGSITASVPTVAAYNGTTNYTHDAKLQLTQESSSRGGGYTNNNAYDSAGNPTTFRGVANGYNANNQNTAFTHDLNGNPTTYKADTLTWDAENRMTSFGSILTAGYRADGLRAWKQTGAGKTYYLYDGDKPVLEEDNSGVKTAVMTFGPNGLLARTTATRTLLYTFDPMGNLSQQIVAGTCVFAS